MSAENVRNVTGAATIAVAAQTNWLTDNAVTISIAISICTFIVFAVSAGIGAYASVKRNKVAQEAIATTRRSLIQDILEGAEDAPKEVRTHIKNHFRGKHET